jgi:hypothetical protein
MFVQFMCLCVCVCVCVYIHTSPQAHLAMAAHLPKLQCSGWDDVSKDASEHWVCGCSLNIGCVLV